MFAVWHYYIQWSTHALAFMKLQLFQMTLCVYYMVLLFSIVWWYYCNTIWHTGTKTEIHFPELRDNVYL